MNIQKAKDWIETYVNLTEGEFRQRVHTGEGVIALPLDIYGCMVSSDLLERVGADKLGYFFDGDFGRTFITVVPFDSAKRRNGVTMRLIDPNRQKSNILVYANKFGLSNAQKFDDLSDELKTQLLSLPYSAIVRPLIIADMGKGEPNISKLAVRYGIGYRTVYKWVHGC